jgi:SAM-dependent methyltransferase
LIADAPTTERAFWGQVAQQAGLATGPVAFPDERSAWLTRILASLGDVRDRHGLDCGAGTGALTRRLSAQGAIVTSSDLAPEMLQVSRQRQALRGLPAARTVAADLGALPFADESLDFATGSFILHHVEVPRAVRELHRVLRPGARAVFAETWLGNPLLAFARTHLAGRFGVARVGTLTEHPITRADVADMRGVFGQVHVRFPEFICFAKAGTNVFRWRPRFRLITGALVALDRAVGRHAPPLRPLGYYCLLELQK